MTKINSAKFLPENLRTFEAYSKFSEVLDWVIDQYHTKNIDALQALYQLKENDFDPYRTLNLLGAQYFFPWDVGDEQYRIICGLLSNLYEIKGTKKGLRYILRLLGLDARIYEWFEINEAFYNGDGRWTHTYPNCSIVLELSLGHNPIGVCPETSKWAIPKHNPPTPDEQQLPEGMSFEDTEGKFKDFSQYLLWVCTFLAEIRWTKIIEDYVTTNESLQNYLTVGQWNHFSGYKFNCPGTIQIGVPIVPDYPFIGSEGYTVGALNWHNQAFVISSFEQYNTINYDGIDKDQLGIIGKSIEEDLPPYHIGDTYQIGNVFSSGLQRYYYIGKIVQTGVTPGTMYISGCSLSRVKDLEWHYYSNRGPGGRGIFISWDRVIGPGYIIDEPGDSLSWTEFSYIQENIPQDSIFFVEWPEIIVDPWKPLIIDDQIGEGFIQPEWRYIGQELMPNDIKINKEIYHEEVFSYNCLQIGAYGNAWDIQQNPGIFIGGGNLVGTGVLDQQGATVFNTYTHPYEIGTYFTLGYGAHIGDGNTISLGMNIIGDEAPWDQGNIAPTSNTIISSWLWDKEDHLIYTEVESEDTLDSALTIEKFQSERLKEIHPNYIGGNQTIVRSTPYYIEGVYYLGSGLIGENEIGGSPQDLLINSGFNIGQYSDVSHDYTIQDHYTRFNLDAFENNFSNSFVPNCQRINNFANNNVYIGSSGLGIGGILQDLYYPPTPDPIIQDLGIFTINPGVLINSINIGQHHTIIIQPPTPEPHISWPELNIGNQYFIGFNYIGNPPVIFNGIYPEPQYYEGYLSVNTQAETITEEVESVDLFSDYTSVSMYEKVFPKNIGGNESIVRIDPYTIQDGITRIGEIEIGVGDPYPDIQEEEVPLLLGEITIGDSSTLNGVRVIQIPITSYTYEDFIGISTKVPEVNIGGVHAVGEAKYKSSDYEVGDPYTKLNIDFEYQAFVEEFEINSPIILISEHNFITFDETLEIGESNIGDSEIGYYTNPPETIFITSNKNSIVDTLTYLDSQLTVTEEIESVDIIDNSLETCISEKVFNTLGSGEFIQGIPLAHVGVGSIGNIQIGPVELSPALNIGDAEVSWNDFIGPEYFTPNQKIKENGTDKISNIYISHSGFSEQFNLNNTEYFEFLQGSNLLYDTPLDGNTTYIELSLGDNPALIDPETGEVLLFDNGNDPEPWYIELVGHDGSYVWNPYDNPRNDILSNLNNIVVEDIISEYHTPIGEGVIWDVD